MTEQSNPLIYFVWGLKRSGIHFFVNWLYANLGGNVKLKLKRSSNRHKQLQRGFFDPESDIIFFNNCGGRYSRNFSLGELAATDFLTAARSHRVVIFGLEDVAMEDLASVTSIRGAYHLLVMRDPLNNIASRLRGSKKHPEVFPVNDRYIDLYECYSKEFIGQTDLLPLKFEVSYNSMVSDPCYRDNLALNLGFLNRDSVQDVSKYGGGSSFSKIGVETDMAVFERYKQEPLQYEYIESLLSRAAIVEICRSVFGYELEEVAKNAFV